MAHLFLTIYLLTPYTVNTESIALRVIGHLNMRKPRTKKPILEKVTREESIAQNQSGSGIFSFVLLAILHSFLYSLLFV